VDIGELAKQSGLTRALNVDADAYVLSDGITVVTQEYLTRFAKLVLVAALRGPFVWECQNCGHEHEAPANKLFV
jgi:hypothetical protein